jgi:hypothetical protein
VLNRRRQGAVRSHTFISELIREPQEAQPVKTRARRLAWGLPFLAVLAIGAVVIAPTALADTASDDRATFHDAANATTCADVGFPNSTILGSGGGGQANGTVTADANFSVTVSAFTGTNSTESSQQINVTALTSGPVIDAVVVKGGNGYNQYNSAVSNMIAPLNNGGNVPAISHWFLCYHGTAPPTTTTTTTTPAIAPAVAARPTFTG